MHFLRHDFEPPQTVRLDPAIEHDIQAGRNPGRHELDVHNTVALCHLYQHCERAYNALPPGDPSRWRAHADFRRYERILRSIRATSDHRRSVSLVDADMCREKVAAELKDLRPGDRIPCLLFSPRAFSLPLAPRTVLDLSWDLPGPFLAAIRVDGHPKPFTHVGAWGRNWIVLLDEDRVRLELRLGPDADRRL